MNAARAAKRKKNNIKCSLRFRPCNFCWKSIARKFSPDLRDRGEVKIVLNQWPRARDGARRRRSGLFSCSGQARPPASNIAQHLRATDIRLELTHRDILQNSRNARKANNIWKQRSVNRCRCRMYFSELSTCNNQKTQRWTFSGKQRCSRFCFSFLVTFVTANEYILFLYYFLITCNKKREQNVKVRYARGSCKCILPSA